MELILAEQAIENKLDMQMSVMVGNYEFYYACGLLSQILDFGKDENTEPKELDMAVKEALKNFQPEGERQKYLAGLLMRYEASDVYDEQMKELFRMGRNQKKR